MNMKPSRIPAMVGALLLGALLAPAAQAIPITLSPGDEVATSNDTGNLNADDVETILGNNGYALPLNLVELYKANVLGADEKGYAASYQTTYSNTASDPADALIEYLEGPSIECPDCFLLVKDGNNSPSAYIFDISAWDGLADISLTGFWPGSGAISHVSIFGNERFIEVPVAGTGLLLALGMLVLGTSLRRSR